jgi:hypothetical protein
MVLFLDAIVAHYVIETKDFAVARFGGVCEAFGKELF